MADPDDIPEPDCIAGIAHPRLSETLIGQNAAALSFLQAYNTGRLHHAWVVTGPRGVGKATLAWHLARFMLQEDLETSGKDHGTDSLHADPNSALFKRVAALGEPRIALLRRGWNRDTKKLRNDITVDEVRKLKSFFSLSAADGGWRVAIVDAADDMNLASANALLKLLEEPPEKTLFFLISHQPGRLLPTIRSRCRTLACERLSNDDLSTVLTHASVDLDTDMDQLRELADGSAGSAITLVQQGGQTLYAEIIAIVATLPQLDRARILKIADGCVGKDSAPTYDLTLKLIVLALNRLAKAGVTETPPQEAAPNEASVMAALSQNSVDGQKWAELAQKITQRTGHAVAVNLDPAGVILDTFLQIEAAARRSS